MPDPIASDLQRPPHTNRTDQLLDWVDRHRGWCFLALGLLYAAAFNGQWRMGSDSAIYVSIGRNVAEGLGFVYHGAADRMVFPGLPWLLGVLFRLDASGSFVGPTLAVAAMSAIVLALVYHTFRLHADRATAVVVTCLTMVAYTFFRLGFEILSDMMFCVGVWGVLAGYETLLNKTDTKTQASWERRAGILGGFLLSIGLLVAVITRPTMWVLCGALAATSLACWFARHRRGIHGALLLLMTLGVAVFLLVDPRGSNAAEPGASVLRGYEQWALYQLQNLGALWRTVATVNGPKFFDPHFTEAVFGLELGPGLNTIAAIVLLVLGVNLGRSRLLWGVWFALMVVAMLIAGPAARYTLPLIPLMAFAWWRAVVGLEKKVPDAHRKGVIVLLILLWCLPNLARVGKFIVEQRRTPFLQAYKKGRYAQLSDLAARIDQSIDPDAVIITEHAHELSYLCRRPVEHTSKAVSNFNHPTAWLRQTLKNHDTVLFVATADADKKPATGVLKPMLDRKILVSSGSQPSASVWSLKPDP